MAWWTVVAVYTALLPAGIVAWRVLIEQVGLDGAGHIPWLVSAAGLGIVGAVAYRRPRDTTQLSALLGAALLGVIVLWWPDHAAKRIHLPEYVLLAALVNHALSTGGGVPHPGRWTLAITTALGVVDEALQGLAPGRFFAIEDIGVNAVSALVGVLVLRALGALMVGAAVDRIPATRWRELAAFWFVLATLVGIIQWNLSTGQNGYAHLPAWVAALIVVSVFATGYRLWAPGPAHAGLRALGAVTAAALLLIAGGRLAGVPFV